MTLETLGADPRVTVRRAGPPNLQGSVVVYWMQRAQRACDNPALDTAIHIGNLLDKPVVVFFGLHPFIERANLRHYRFLIDGLDELAEGLSTRRVGFVLRTWPAHQLGRFVEQSNAVMVIGDDNPLRQQERWRDALAQSTPVPFWTVDADVVVPSRLIETEQYGARTIRPRLHKHLASFLVRSTEPVAHVACDPSWWPDRVRPGPHLLDALPIDRSVAAVQTFRGGLKAARRRLRHFIGEGLGEYDRSRNHPELEGTSQLSPYLHFGQIGPREIALAAQSSGAPATSVEAFLEQLIVRRELAVNFVRYNDAYDRLDGCESWARQTLRRHRFDPRPHVYGPEQLEAAQTHDPLWNAAQRQMITTGWMHGYVRMYWAKKILEWSEEPEQAFDAAVRLNDRYQLDGRDPNGYANIAWAIGGKHDRPWPTRPIYGAIRAMTLVSTSRKFDAAAYIERYDNATVPAAAGRDPVPLD